MGDLTRPRTVKCARCGERIAVKPQGRLPRYCSQSCRSMHFKSRERAAKPTLSPMPLEEKRRAALWDALREFGLVSGDLPPRRKPDGEPT
jgi:DNA-directed RNA polymerase subunit RPC12/RpoP